MSENMAQFAPDLSRCSPGEWLGKLRNIGQENGFAVSLGRKHAGIFIDGNDTLLVSFETIGGIKALSETHTPFGFDMVRGNGWSSLNMISSGDTWFRDPQVYGFFDQLMDDGFFDDFENVIFFGAGPAGYAAAAYSVSAPGSRVLTLQPQATLDPRVTEWDDRFPEQRRMDFTSRYGYAPDMIDAAAAAYVIYDPRQALDAMHSSLFERRNVTRFRVPFMGGALLSDFRTMDLLPSLLSAVAEDRLDTATFARLMRARRQHMPYLRKLLAHTDREHRLTLSRWLCANVGPRMSAPRFRRRLEQIEAMDEANAEV